MRTAPRQLGRQAGIALVLVLLVTTLLMVIAASFAQSLRTDIALIENTVARARLDAAADAAIHRSVFEVYRPALEADRWKPDGEMHEMAIGDVRVKVSMVEESGKIDVNVAVPDLLKGMFLSVGLRDDVVTNLVDAIMDWRDNDSLRRANGAEEPEYRAAGLKHSPANGPFQTVEELQLVLGMRPEIYRAVQPIITVYSRQPGLNFNLASRAAMLSVPGVSEAEIDAYIAQRQAARAAGQFAPPFAPGARFAASQTNLAFSVRAQAVAADGSELVRTAVFRLSPDPRRPFALLALGEEAQVPERPGQSSGTAAP